MSAPTSAPSEADHWTGEAARMARAAARGDARAVAAARAAGADPNAVSRQGMPMLLWPVTHGCLPGFEALLAEGADPNAAYASDTRRGVVGDLLAKQEDAAFLKAALGAGLDPDGRAPGTDGVLWSAILAGNWPAVQALIEAGADADTPDHEGGWYTPLAFYSTGAFDKVVWLLEHGADAGVTAERRTKDGTVRVRPVLEDIFYYRIDAERFPDLAAAQRRAQSIVQNQGHRPPPRPNRYPV